MKTELSAIICTNNPRSDFLDRTLAAIERQSLSTSRWELIIIDNASRSPVSETHPIPGSIEGKYVREEKLGLTNARIRGIRESEGEILVFIDDDNILDPNYFTKALEIAFEAKFLGAWGGSCVGEFETPPPESIAPFLGNLAIRTVTDRRWSNIPFNYESTPIGAGMCLRRSVALHYLQRIQNDDRLTVLDRKGGSLMSCGDHDIAFTACDIGLGVGVFPELSLVHLIPAERFDESYILKLLEADAYSTCLLKSIRGYKVPVGSLPQSPLDPWRSVYHAFKRAMGVTKTKSFFDHARAAKRSGVERALKFLSSSRDGDPRSTDNIAPTVRQL